MSPQASPSVPPKPTLPPFWKWLMRITFAVTMVLFLAPAVYVVKYYAVDRPREAAIREVPASAPLTADYLSAEAKTAHDLHRPSQTRTAAVHQIGLILRRPGINWQRPLECLTAKATLANLAVKEPDPAVKAAAAEELEKVAQGGAVIRR